MDVNEVNCKKATRADLSALDRPQPGPDPQGASISHTSHPTSPLPWDSCWSSSMASFRSVARPHLRASHGTVHVCAAPFHTSGPLPLYAPLPLPAPKVRAETPWGSRPPPRPALPSPQFPSSRNALRRHEHLSCFKRGEF